MMTLTCDGKTYEVVAYEDCGPGEKFILEQIKEGVSKGPEYSLGDGERKSMREILEPANPPDSLPMRLAQVEERLRKIEERMSGSVFSDPNWRDNAMP